MAKLAESIIQSDELLGPNQTGATGVRPLRAIPVASWE
jgi:hypothetical protein